MWMNSIYNEYKKIVYEDSPFNFGEYYAPWLKGETIVLSPKFQRLTIGGVDMICPLRRNNNSVSSRDNECEKEGCEWYIEKTNRHMKENINMCSIKLIAITLYNIEVMYNIKG